MSRRAGSLSERELPLWLRTPLLGLYARVFGCNMSEAVEEEVGKYRSLSAFFTRSLKPDARPISRDHSLVWPLNENDTHEERKNLWLRSPLPLLAMLDEVF